MSYYGDNFVYGSTDNSFGTANVNDEQPVSNDNNEAHHPPQDFAHCNPVFQHHNGSPMFSEGNNALPQAHNLLQNINLQDTNTLQQFSNLHVHNNLGQCSLPATQYHSSNAAISNFVIPPFHATAAQPTSIYPHHFPSTAIVTQSENMTINDFGPHYDNNAHQVNGDLASTHDPRWECCGIVFGRRAELRRHAKGHNEPPTYKCFKYNCNKTFHRRDKLTDHMWQGHRLNVHIIGRED